MKKRKYMKRLATSEINKLLRSSTELGKVLFSLRKARGLTRHEVAHRANVSYDFVRALEIDKYNYAIGEDYLMALGTRGLGIAAQQAMVLIELARTRPLGTRAGTGMKKKNSRPKINRTSAAHMAKMRASLAAKRAAAARNAIEEEPITPAMLQILQENGVAIKLPTIQVGDKTYRFEQPVELTDKTLQTLKV